MLMNEIKMSLKEAMSSNKTLKGVMAQYKVEKVYLDKK